MLSTSTPSLNAQLERLWDAHPSTTIEANQRHIYIKCDTLHLISALNLPDTPTAIVIAQDNDNARLNIELAADTNVAAINDNDTHPAIKTAADIHAATNDDDNWSGVETATVFTNRDNDSILMMTVIIHNTVEDIDSTIVVQNKIDLSIMATNATSAPNETTICLGLPTKNRLND